VRVAVCLPSVGEVCLPSVGDVCESTIVDLKDTDFLGADVSVADLCRIDLTGVKLYWTSVEDVCSLEVGCSELSGAKRFVCMSPTFPFD